ncbi:hypothetical protein [Rudaea sp.]|uniref:hypothetical protein n=1 Tax=Rudaea sp. TaxID=2136325 RepID=UPI002ED40199
MRWILLVVCIVAFTVAFTTGSPSLMGVGLILGCGGLLGFALSLAAARIASTAQPEAALIIDPEISALRAKANLARSGAAASPQPTIAPDHGADTDASGTA